MHIYCDFSKISPIQDVLPLVQELVKELARKKNIEYFAREYKENICLSMGTNEYTCEITIAWGLKSHFERKSGSIIYKEVSFEQFLTTLNNVEPSKTIGPVIFDGGVLKCKGDQMCRNDAKKLVDAAVTLISSGYSFTFVGGEFKLGCARLTLDELRDIKFELDRE